MELPARMLDNNPLFYIGRTCFLCIHDSISELLAAVRVQAGRHVVGEDDDAKGS